MTARQEAGRAQTHVTYCQGAVRAYARRLAAVDPVRHPGRYASIKAMLDEAITALAEARQVFVEKTATHGLLLDSPPAMPCLHKRAKHEHGTLNAYAYDRCRCAPCKEAKSTYEKHRKWAISYGRWNAWVDAEPARAHVLDRIERTGIPWRRLAQRAGLSVDTMERLLYGVPTRGVPLSRRIRRDTADKLVSAVGLWPDQSTPNQRRQRIADKELANGSIQRDAGVRELVAPVERAVPPAGVHGAGQHGR